MWKPWEGYTGLAKALAVFATIFSVSLGLCGVNLAAVAGSNILADHSGIFSDVFTRVFLSGLIITGYLEMAGIAIGLAGIVIVCLIWLAIAIVGVFRKEG